MEITELYSIESSRREAAIRGEFRKVEDINQTLLNKTKHIPHFQFRNSQIEKEIESAYLSKELLRLGLSVGNQDETSGLKDDTTEYRKFVEELLDVDLSNVTVAHVSGDFSKAEGRLYSCGRDRHVVVLPPKGHGFLSADLLVHELGHAAEVSLRRQNDDVSKFINHIILNEAIAHFCQYRYLKEFGTRIERISALNSVIPLYMMLKARVVTKQMRVEPNVVQTERIVGHKEFADFRKVYTTLGLKKSLMAYEDYSLLELYHKAIAPRFGSVLALRLLNDTTSIKKLCVAPTDIPVRQVLNELNLNTNKLLDFSKADELFKKFIEGTL